MNLVDANIIIRFLVKDDKLKAQKCYEFFEKIVAGKIKALVLDMAIAEVVWVLGSVYKLKKKEIRALIEAILNTPNLDFQNKEILLESVVLYEIHNIDFIDAFHKVFMQKKKIDTIYSYDRDFDSFGGIKRVEP